jgi:proteasome accessory factor B
MARSALISVEPGSDAATRLQKRRGTITDGERMTLHFSDFDLLADELAGYGPEVLVESPPELRDAVLGRLMRTVADHG